MVYMSIRTNKELKSSFRIFCSKKGVSLSKAIILYIGAFVKRGNMPYTIIRETQFEKEDATIGLRINQDLRDRFNVLCDEHGMTASFYVRDFMIECITDNKDEADEKWPYDIESEDSALSNRVKAVRTGKNMSQQELADLVGTSRMTIYSIENGDAAISSKLAEALCSALGVSYKDLF